MRITRFGEGVDAAAIRGLAPAPRAVEEDVRAIVASVRAEGDEALRAETRRLDGVDLASRPLRVTRAALESAVELLDGEVCAAIETAKANVEIVARAQVGEDRVIELPGGQRIELRELAVARAGAYIPSGRAPYPSSVVMCAATALAAGVERLAVCVAPGPDGRPDPIVLAACRLCGVDEVYRVGGAQAIAALAYGTESINAVDVIVGPGNAWVQEAKRQVAGIVGLDGIAGPSELVVVAAGEGVDAEPIALDLLAQAEHGEDGLLALITIDAQLADQVAASCDQLAAQRPSVCDASLAIVTLTELEPAVALADELAPEHLELLGEGPLALLDRVRRAGAVFAGTATAFGDYVAGSNHVLPTGGAGRFQSALSVQTFRRRMACVTIDGQAARTLATPGAALARAEGFPVHAESMEVRAR